MGLAVMQGSKGSDLLCSQQLAECLGVGWIHRYGVSNLKWDRGCHKIPRRVNREKRNPFIPFAADHSFPVFQWKQRPTTGMALLCMMGEPINTIYCPCTMDIFTQGLAGAIVASSAAGKPHLRPALAIGFFAGMLADIDILIRAADDPLFNIEFHRHFTHALLFVPIGGLIAALLAWPVARRHLPFRAIALYGVLGYLPSGLLDACTSFGTHLLWPFSDARIAWNLISIIDPVFSLALMAGLLFAWRRQQALPARIAACMALVYLTLGLVQRDRVEEFMAGVARERGHAVARIEVKPTLGNIVLWRAIYENGPTFHVDAVHASPWNGLRHYPGGAIARFAPESLPGLAPGTAMASDIARFTRLSEGYVIRHPERPGVLGDVRYAMLPNSTLPLWGISLDLDKPDRHAALLTFRHLEPSGRGRFLTMLRGLPAGGPDDASIQR